MRLEQNRRDEEEGEEEEEGHEGWGRLNRVRLWDKKKKAGLGMGG